MPFTAIIAAAGHGTRAQCGSASHHKQFADLCGKPVLWHAVRPFAECEQIAAVHIVVAAGMLPQAQAAVDDFAGKVTVSESGGDTRGESVRNGLAHCRDGDWVLVHDAARPCLPDADLRRLLDAFRQDDAIAANGAILATPLNDAIKKTAAADSRVIVGSLPRAGMWAAQTPQLFPVTPLRAALQRFPNAADEAEAMAGSGFQPLIVTGDRRNIKITYESDFAIAAMFLQTLRHGEPAASAERL